MLEYVPESSVQSTSSIACQGMVALTGGWSHNSEAEGHWHRSVPTLRAVCSALEAGGGLTFTFCPVTWQAWPGPHTAQPSGLQCLWTKLNQEWASALGHLSRVQGFCDPMDCSPPGSSVHGISQARILEWVAMPSSGGSSRTRDRTRVSHVSCIEAGSLLLAPPGGPREETICRDFILLCLREARESYKSYHCPGLTLMWPPKKAEHPKEDKSLSALKNFQISPLEHTFIFIF